MDANDPIVKVCKSLVVSSNDLHWKVPADFVKTVAGEEFIKLSASRSFGFIRLVCGPSVDKNYSLSGTVGYAKLQQLRNDKQQPDQEEDASQPLFEEAPADAKKRKKMPKGEAASARANPRVYEIALGGTDVKVLEAAHPMEAVWVVATDAAMSAVMGFLQSHGFDKTEAEGEEEDVAPRADNVIKMGKGRRATKQPDGSLKYVKKAQ